MLTVDEFNFWTEELERKEALLLECQPITDIEVLNLVTQLEEQIQVCKKKLGFKV